MRDLFSAFLDSLPAVAGSPLVLVALILMIIAATFLFWKQRKYRSLAETLIALPEHDRLERIRIDYGVRPKRGVSAETWLASRRQEFLFWVYVSTLLAVLLAFIVVFGRVIEVPGGLHRDALRKSYAVLHDKIESYELAARNLRDAFSLAGENAIGPDKLTAQILAERIERYNAAYGDLRTNQKAYVESVVRWLENRPDLASEATNLVQFALEDCHQAGVFQFNDAAYRRTQQVRVLPKSASPGEVQLIRTSGALEIQQIASKLDTLLDVLARRRHAIAAEIMGHS